MRRNAVKVFRRQQSTVPLAGNMPRMPAKKRDFAAEVNAVKKWWQSDRFRDTVRPYTAEVRASPGRAGPPAPTAHSPSHSLPGIPPAQEVVKLRGSVTQVHAAGEMSTKMYDTLQLCKASGGHSRTFGESAHSHRSSIRPGFARVAPFLVSSTPIPS
jgi:hypothetical protein